MACGSLLALGSDGRVGAVRVSAFPGALSRAVPSSAAFFRLRVPPVWWVWRDPFAPCFV